MARSGSMFHSGNCITDTVIQKWQSCFGVFRRLDLPYPNSNWRGKSRCRSRCSASEGLALGDLSVSPGSVPIVSVSWSTGLVGWGLVTTTPTQRPHTRMPPSDWIPVTAPFTCPCS